MKVNRKDLLKAMTSMKVKTNDLHVINDGNKLRLSTSEDDFFISLTVDGEFIEDVNALVNADELRKFLTKLKSETVTIIGMSEDCKVVHDKGVFNMDADDSSRVTKPQIDGEWTKICDLNFLSELTKVATYVSKDDLRPAITGVNFNSDGTGRNELNIVATDANILIIKNMGACAPFVPFILPVKHIKLFFEGEMYTKKGWTKIQNGDDYIVVKNIDGNYVNYNSVIPNGDTVLIELDKKELLEGIDILEMITNYYNAVKLDTATMQLSATNGKKQSSYKLIGSCPESIEVFYDCKYLAKAVKEIQFDKIIIENHGYLRPNLMKDDITTILLMSLDPYRCQ